MFRTFKDYLIVLFGTAFSRGLSFLNSVIVARILGPEDFGRFSIFFIVSVLTWIFPQAFDTSYVRFAKTSNSHAEKDKFLRSSIFLKLLYGVFVAVISYPLAMVLATHVFHKPEIKGILIFGLLSGVFQSFLMSIASIFQEKENFTIFAFVYSFYTGLIFVLLLVMVVMQRHFSLANVVLVYFASSVCVGVISLGTLFVKKLKTFMFVNKEFLSKTFSLSKWAFGTNILSSLFPRLDTLFLPRFVEFGLLGIYSAAQQIIMVISVMTGSISSTFLPKACRAVESAKQFAAFRRESLWLAGVINLLVAILFILAPILLPFIFGAQYQLAGRITQILLVGWFVSIFYFPFAGIFYVIDEAPTRFWLEVARFGLAVPLLLFCIPRWGIMGAAIAVSTTLIVNTVLSLVILRAQLKIKKKWYAIN